MGTPVRHTDISVRGHVFPTLRAAADHFGVQYQTALKAMQAGTLDTLGQGWRPVVPMKVRVRNLVFQTAKDAARHFGVRPEAIYEAIREGRIDRLGLERHFHGIAPREVEAFGCRWPSRARACRELGLHHAFFWHFDRNPTRARREILLRAVMAWRARAEARAAADAEMIEVIQIKKIAGKPARAVRTWTRKQAA